MAPAVGVGRAGGRVRCWQAPVLAGSRAAALPPHSSPRRRLASPVRPPRAPHSRGATAGGGGDVAAPIG